MNHRALNVQLFYKMGLLPAEKETNKRKKCTRGGKAKMRRSLTTQVVSPQLQHHPDQPAQPQDEQPQDDQLDKENAEHNQDPALEARN